MLDEEHSDKHYDAKLQQLEFNRNLNAPTVIV